MDSSKYRKFFKEENYVHCSICGDYSNINSFAHRKSINHQKKLTKKIHKISFHLLEKKKRSVVVHDADWPEKDFKRFCHFCGKEYPEHHSEDEFVIETLGSLYHHASSSHLESVKTFLKRNYREEKSEKFLVKNNDLDSYLAKIPDAKKKYLKKMDLINHLVLKQMQASEEERTRVLQNEMQVLSTSSEHLKDCDENESSETNLHTSMLNSTMIYNVSKVPPWLEDNPQSSGHQPTVPIIGPTMDTLVKHVVNQKKKGLSRSRVGANFKHHVQHSSKWLPSFQGVWNQGRRKQLKIQFNRRNHT